MTWTRLSNGISGSKCLVCVFASLFTISLAVGCGRDQGAKPNAKANNVELDSSPSSSVSKSLDTEVKILSEAKADPRQVLVKVAVSGFKQSEGACRIAVYLGPQHFNDPEFAIVKESVAIQGGTASLEVTVDIPPGNAQADAEPIRLAVSAYHDQNGNSQLDKNSFGIPTELYGFSKNPKRGFGPPKFSEVAIEMKLPLMSSEPLDVPITVK